ncbi:MAG: 30S ribosome-binding factor RbfA [Calditrichaeota bacterium]|nr:30S ribosome-binding factor RbfA [Calditrichota bacterium]MCB0289064.1 30S ribosome-binding factor RbfA [Calditrichota bacterium]MCB0302904.1 30S ribosome-binding factor RbfA [Calditrichota bacterium]MCB0313911.1 30S ribosome-binding factor RbfA [Calditrichota bacterium]MCB9088635.1 30S ribosome-binding factor RbfA [Calditrichia bacterium]
MAESVRQKKVADRVKKLVSVVIDRKVNDPDKGFVTITHVKMSPDLRIASIYFTAFGDAAVAKKSLNALERAKNFIRNEIAPELKMRFLPELRFFVDDTQEYARQIGRLLDDMNKEDDEI